MAHSLTKALLALPAAATAYVVGHVLHMAHRSDIPELPNQDVSGVFGDPGLPHLRMVAIGDSSLTAPGVENLDRTWVRTGAIAISDRFHVELISLAVGGSRAEEVLRDQLGPALALRPDIAVVAVGSNDALRTPNLRRYEVILHEIVAALHDVAPAVVLLGVGDLGTVPRLPRLFSPVVSRRARRTDRCVERVVDSYHRAERIPAWGAISAVFQTRDVELWSADLFHASDKGHEAFEVDTVPTFERALRHLETR